MDQKRFLLFFATSMLILIGWTRFVAPMFAPPMPPAGQEVAKPNEAAKPPIAPGQPPKADPVKPPGDEPQPPPKASPTDLPKHPRKTIKLGSLDPNSGYFIEAELTTAGASVVAIRLNDPRYKELEDRALPLTVVGSGDALLRTFQSTVPAIDAQLLPLGKSLATWDWEVVATTPDPKNPGAQVEAVFRAKSPDGRTEVLKRYSVVRVGEGRDVPQDVRDANSAGYELRLAVVLRNVGDEPQSLSYALVGPVGVPLEDPENARKFRDLRTAFVDDDGGIAYGQKTAKEIAEAYDEGTLEEEQWRNPLQYVGVDVQFFAALVARPHGDAANSVAIVQPQLVEAAKRLERSDVTARLTSVEVPLAAGKSVTHDYVLFAGPKREPLLAAYGAAVIMDYGYTGVVAKAMRGLLTFLHDTLAIPYGIAIIVLTVIVRGCMYPLSRKQAVGAKKMKELQPKLAELKKKLGNDKEKFARAQMQLFSENNYNPLAGCLPVLLQLPIFIGLYTALGTAVDLRMAPFLWIDNLAAPDAIVKDLGFSIPFLGRQLNLLPFVTIVLFIVQQKMFMPPPTDEQSAMQQKMMNYMMVFMGFMFYHVPSGLCVYFIASSLWGLGERKLLDLNLGSRTADPAATTTDAPAVAEKPTGRAAPAADEPPKREGFFGRLLASADAAATQGKGQLGKSSSPDRAGGSKKNSKPRR